MQHGLLVVLVLVSSIQLSINGARASDSLASDAAESRERKTYQGLIPFPRIGRSRAMNRIDFKNFREIKREGVSGLIPFPRTGRSEPKRNGGGPTAALWFGPRLGKRNNLDYNTDNLLAESMMDYFIRNNLAREELLDQQRLDSDPPLSDQFM